MEKKKELRVMVPEELYNKFKKNCKNNFKSVSEVIRDNMLKYIRKK